MSDRPKNGYTQRGTNRQGPRRDRGKYFRVFGSVFLIVAVVCGAAYLLQKGLPPIFSHIFGGGERQHGAYLTAQQAGEIEIPSWIEQRMIPVNGAGRRGEELECVRNIVVHYVGNPGTSADQNHSYFAQPQTEVSSHFLVGLDGEILQCVPLNEKCSATSERNRDTIAIEVCHPDETGKFTEASYRALVRLTAWLCRECNLTADEVIRHYDATGKECPLYYVKNESAWLQFQDDVADAID